MSKFIIESGFINVLKAMDNKIHYALGEFVDNSIQSYEDNKKKLDTIPGYKPKISINVTGNDIIIEDNCAGISEQDEIRAFSLAKENPNAVGMGTFGMGMKVSACWFTDTWSLETKHVDESQKKTWNIDVKKISKDADFDIGPKKSKYSGNPYTKITLKNCRSQCIPRTTQVTQIRDHIADMYRWHILDEIVSFYYNGQKLEYELPPQKIMPLWSDQPKETKVPMKIWDSIDQKRWIAEIPKLPLGKGENGELWAYGMVWLREKSAGANQKGFSIFWKNRLLEGMVGNTWMPGGPEWSFEKGSEELEKCGIYSGPNRETNIYLEGYLHMSPNFQKSFQTNSLDWEGKKNTLAEKLKEYLQSATIYGDESGEKYDLITQAKNGKWKQHGVDEPEPDEEEDEGLDGPTPEGFGEGDGGEIDIDIPDVEDEPEPEEPDSEDPRQTSRDFKFEGIVYKTTIFLDNNDSESFFSHNDGPKDDPSSKEKDVKLLQIRVNFGHPFIKNYFSRINGEKEREGLYRIAIAFVLAERLALNNPVKNRALYVGKFFNKIIENPNF